MPIPGHEAPSVPRRDTAMVAARDYVGEGEVVRPARILDAAARVHPTDRSGGGSPAHAGMDPIPAGVTVDIGTSSPSVPVRR